MLNVDLTQHVYSLNNEKNKARDTLETQGAPDTLRTGKVLVWPKDSKGFQKNPKNFQTFPKHSKHFQIIKTKNKEF